MTEWWPIISLMISAMIAVGGFIVTVLMGVLGWSIKRLIAAVDGLKKEMENMHLDMKDRPSWDMVKREVGESIGHHENAWHREGQRRRSTDR